LKNTEIIVDAPEASIQMVVAVIPVLASDGFSGGHSSGASIKLVVIERSPSLSLYLWTLSIFYPYIGVDQFMKQDL
jgi:hypothetical protein